MMKQTLFLLTCLTSIYDCSQCGSEEALGTSNPALKRLSDASNCRLSSDNSSLEGESFLVTKDGELVDSVWMESYSLDKESIPVEEIEVVKNTTSIPFWDVSSVTNPIQTGEQGYQWYKNEYRLLCATCETLNEIDSSNCKCCGINLHKKANTSILVRYKEYNK